MVTSPVEYGGVKSAAFLGWMTMVLGAALIRGGWVSPLFTDIPGWVSITPILVVLRVLYFNLALAVAAYGGGLLGTPSTPLPLLLVAWSGRERGSSRRVSCACWRASNPMASVTTFFRHGIGGETRALRNGRRP